MKAAIYVRYSSDNQRESSLEDQERLCRQEADRLGYSVVEVYEDAALSGTLGEDQRPGFAAMMEAAKRKAFDALIVDDSSRLSRDTSDALRALKRSNIGASVLFLAATALTPCGIRKVHVSCLASRAPSTKNSCATWRRRCIVD